MKKSVIRALALSLMITFSFTADCDISKIHSTGTASWYKHGTTTANGERFKPYGLTAAHRTLPFGTMVQVTNVKNHKTVVVRINDRGPFIGKRIIDLSLGAARVIKLDGVGKVVLRVL